MPPFFGARRAALLGSTAVIPAVLALSALVGDLAGEALPSWLSLARASAATYTGAATSGTTVVGARASAASGAPRFDFATGAPALLVEPQATNTASQNQPTSAAWSISNNDSANTAITFNAANGADGSKTMALIAAASTASTVRQMEQDGIALVAGQANCFSFDAGAAGETAGHVQLNINTTGGLAGAMVVFYSLTGKGAVLVGGDLAGSVSGKAASITLLPSGLYRVSVVFTAPATATTANAYIGPCSTDYANSGRGYVGTVGKGIFAGVVQMEAGSFPTSPIATTTAAVTRAADVVTLSGTASAYLAAGGSYILERQSIAPGSSPERVYGTGALAALPTGYRYTKVAVYSRALSVVEQAVRTLFAFDPFGDLPGRRFNAGVNLNLFFGYGPVNPTVAGSSYRALTDAIVADLVSYGVKFVRIPIRHEQIDPDRNGSFDQGTLSALDAAGAKLAAAGISWIIDVHNSFIVCANQSNINDTTAYHYLGNADGVYTQAQYVTLMSGLAARYKNAPGMVGFDMQNEPAVSATVCTNAYKAAISAMRAAGYTGEIIIEITDADIASGLYSLDLDPLRNIRWSFHTYPVGGGASGDYGSANAIAQGVPVRVLVNRISANFRAFVSANGGKGHIGEMAVGLDGTYWTGRPGMLDATLAFCRAWDYPITAWDHDSDTTIADANNLSYRDGGTRPRPQRVVMALYNGVSVSPTAAFTGPASSYRLAVSSFVFDWRGIPATGGTFTPNDGGKGGTFSPASFFVPANTLNVYQVVTYTAPASDQSVTLSWTNDGGLINPAPVTLAVAGAAPAAAGFTPLQADGQAPLIDAKFVGTPGYYGVSSIADLVTGSPVIESAGLATAGKQCAFTTAVLNAMPTKGPFTLMVEVDNFSGVPNGARIVGSSPSGPGTMIYAGGNSVVGYAADGSGGPQASSAGSAAAQTRIAIASDGTSSWISVGGSDAVEVTNAAGMRPSFLGWTGDTGDPSTYPNHVVRVTVHGFKVSKAGVKALTTGTSS
ncbi:cellulase family glycosylhydrolase [Methylobacterium sp. GC_Met_2]|uniref:phage head spike fiber domain-containing protein n=1 Tax=Methylobacterium sp. GC_Met_2 TaxID=2937376 RepID=UPI00226B4E65|nr:cellulase family glycosylhydrolase [Methylobacterium sp. GC_Met_2]